MGDNQPRRIYVWTVNSHDLEREYIRIGVDGIISDDLAKPTGDDSVYPPAGDIALGTIRWESFPTEHFAPASVS